MIRFDRPAVWLMGTLALTVGVYWNGLSGPLIYDDGQALRDLIYWLDGQTGWQQVVFDNGTGPLGRSLSMASFVAVALIGGTDVFVQKAFNLALHLVNGGLVFLLLRAFERRGALGGSRRLPTAKWALLGAALWLLHPLLVSSVLYLVQRMTLLSACFTLVAMLLFLHGRTLLDEGRRTRAWWLLAGAVPFAIICAALAKENGVLALPLCATLEFFLFGPKPGLRRSRGSTAFLLLGVVVPAAIVLLLTLLSADFLVGGYAEREFGMTERLLTQSRVLWHYIGSLLVPSGPALGLFHDDFSISRSLTQPLGTAFAIAGWLAVVTAAWRLRVQVPGFALGVAFYLIGHVLESSVIPLMIYFEHRNYLPAVGAIWALLSLAAWLIERVPPSRAGKWAPALAMLVIATLAFATFNRAGIWSSTDMILSSSSKTHPDSRALRQALFWHHFRQLPGGAVEARKHAQLLQQARSENATRLGHASELLLDCALQKPAQPGGLPGAYGGTARLIEIDLLSMTESLAKAVRDQKCTTVSPLELAQHIAGMLDRSPLPPSAQSVWRLRFANAALFARAGDLARAREQAELALQAPTVEPPVAMLLARLLIHEGDMEGAQQLVSKWSSAIAPSDFEGTKELRSIRALIAQGNTPPGKAEAPPADIP